MEEFTNEVVEGEFNAFPPVTATELPEQVQDKLAVLHAEDNNMSTDVTKQEIAALGDEFLGASSRTLASNAVETVFTQDVKAAIEVTSLPGVQAAEATRAAAQEVILNTKAPEVVSAILQKPGSIWDVLETRLASRDATIQRMMAERSDQTNLTLLNGILSLADIVVSSPLDALSGAAFRRVDLAKELSVLRTADITEEEFNNKITSVLDEAANAGWFTSVNELYTFGQIGSIETGGVGLDAKLDTAGALLDLLGVGGVIAGGIRGGSAALRAARSTTSIVRVLKGGAAAKKELTEALARPDTSRPISAGVPQHAVPGFTRMPDPAGNAFGYTAPGADVAAKFERNNTFLKIIDEARLSATIDPDVLAANTPRLLAKLDQELNATSRNNVLNMRVDPDGRGNIFGTISFGRRDGTPYARKGDATKAANRIGLDARIVEHAEGGEVVFTVDQTKNLSKAGLVDALDVQEIGTHFFREWGATFLTVPRRLELLAKSGESVFGAINQKITPILKKATKGTNKEEQGVVDQVFQSLRDGDTHASKRRAFTDTEFKTEYQQLNKGKAPSEAAVELYNTIQELNDAVYFVKANKVFGDIVDEGSEVLQFKFLNGGEEETRNFIVKAIPDGLAPETVIYDLVSGERKALSDVRPNKGIYEVSGGVEVGEEVARYVSISDPKLRRVYHSDVLGYNAGGPRQLDQAKFYVGQNTTVDFVGGGSATGRKRTAMATVTRKEAQTAAEQITRVFDKVRALVPGLNDMRKGTAIQAMKDVANDPELIAILGRNNDWNNDMNSMADFIKFVEDQRLDPRRAMGFNAADDIFGEIDEAGEVVFGGRKSETHRDAFDSALNAPRNGPRRNDPLMGFGGDINQTISPIDTISNDYLRTVHSRTFQAYNFQAVEGWLQGAEKHGRVVDGLKGRAKMNAMTFGDKPGDEARSFMAARDAINRTIGQVSKSEQAWNARVDRLADAIYDKGFQKTGKTLAQMQVSKAPLEALRGFAFHARLGMLAVDQLFVQSSQIFNIIAIAGVEGGRGSLAAFGPVQMALLNGNKEFVRELGRRAGSFLGGMDADEFEKFIRWTKESGRLVVEGTVSELNTVNTVMAKGMRHKVGNVSRTFFDAGERVPRIAAIHTAWQEYRKLFPKLDPFGNHGTNWITQRQDALTAAMTRTSAAAWQKGPLSVPLQFMSYSSRMMESIFSDRLLTKTERIRLAAGQGIFWGAAGTGIGGPILDAYVEEGGLDLSRTGYTAWRYGILDSIIQATTGSETGIGARLAVGEGFWDMYKNFAEGRFAEVLGGPSVQAVVDSGDVILTLMGQLARGETNMVEADVKKLLRTFTGPNKLLNAYIMYTLGDSTSRDGSTVAGGLTKSDAILGLIGAPLQEVTRTYTRMEVMRDQDDHLKGIGKRMAELIRESRKLVDSGDEEGAASIIRTITVMNNKLEPWQQRKVEKWWRDEPESLYWATLEKMRKRNQSAGEVEQNVGEGE